MNEEQFWTLLALARKDRAGGFHRALEALSDVELEEFAAMYRSFRRQLMKPANLAKIAEPGNLGRLAEIAEWVVVQGMDDFEDALFGDTPFPDRLPPGVTSPHLDGDAAAIYKARTGRWIPNRASASEEVELDQDEFWRLAALAQTDPAAFRSALQTMRPEDLIAFYWDDDALRRVFAKARFKQYLDPKVTESWEAWMSFTDWLLSLGRDKVEKILSDPREMPANVPEGAEGFPLNEDAPHIFESRFNEELPLRKRESTS